MAKVIVEETNLARIAQAIRVKTGTDQPLYPSEMASAIMTISRPSGTINLQTNGTHNVIDYSQATVNVPNHYTAEDDGKVVVGESLVTQSALSITANGNYDTTAIGNVVVSVSHMTESLVASQNGVYEPSLYAYSRVVVNVSAPAPTLESISIISNGVYEPSEGVDGFSGVVVDVPVGTDTGDATLSDGAQMRRSVTAYARGSKYTGTMPDYSGSVNSGVGSIGSYGVYSGGYYIAPSTSDVVVPTKHKVFLSDLTIASYSASSAVVNLQDILIESNGTYVADEGYDGFGNVVVDVDGGGEAVLSEGYFSVNGTHYAADIGIDGWSAVTVNMPSYTLSDITLSSSGVYNASSYGVDGWSRVVISSLRTSAVKVINSGTFFAGSYGFEGFSEVTIIDPAVFSTLSEITFCQFNDTLGLVDLSLPNVGIVSGMGFQGCVDLVSVSAPVCTVVSDYAFKDCVSLENLYLPQCSIIREQAFSSCALQTVDLPSCVSLGGHAFANCDKLSTASLPLCEYVGVGAFYSCASLASVSIPTCQAVDTLAFYGCSTLSAVSLPLCSYIGESAFKSASALSTVHLMGSAIVSLGGSAFDTKPDGYPYIYVPSSLYSSYIAKSFWSDIAAQIYSA